jgi:glycosyltransferase involved in cell wall biosynthesis
MGREVKLVIVGGGSTRDRIEAECWRRNVDVLIVGPVSSTETAPYFLASDVGLYPGDDTPYFMEAAPLKILEYTAAGAQVVTSRVYAHENWTNIHMVRADAIAMAEGITRALTDPQPCHDLTGYSWADVAQGLRRALGIPMSARTDVRTLPIEGRKSVGSAQSQG